MKLVDISSHGWNECENCVRVLLHTFGLINTPIPQIRKFTTLAQVLKYTVKCMGKWMPFLWLYLQVERWLVSGAFSGRSVQQRLLLELMLMGQSFLAPLLLHVN